MQTVKSFENLVKDVEGFNVRVCREGRKVRGDKKVNLSYTYRRCAPDNSTVSQFIGCRAQLDDDMYVEVLNNEGQKVHGRTKLNTVRKSYV